MRVAIAGGSGFLGTEITGALVSAGHEVTVVSRHRPPESASASTKWAEGDVTKPDGLAGALSGAEVVVDAVQFPNSPVENPRKGYTFERVDLGGTRNLVDAARASGAGQFIGLSGVGAGQTAPYHWLRFKWQEEQYIMASGLPYTVFRPSWIYGKRDVSLNRFLGFTRFLPFVPVIGNGKTRINPLFVGDLGKHVAAAVGNDAVTNRLFEIGGPEVLTMDEVIRSALRVAGKRRLLLHSPRAMMKGVATLAQFAPGRPLTPDAIDFITMDGVADTGPLEAAFGIRLTPLHEGLATYLGRR